MEALSALVEGGLAKAYDLAGCTDPFSRELPGMPQLDLIEKNLRTYFYAHENRVEPPALAPFGGNLALRR